MMISELLSAVWWLRNYNYLLVTISIKYFLTQIYTGNKTKTWNKQKQANNKLLCFIAHPHLNIFV